MNDVLCNDVWSLVFCSEVTEILHNVVGVVEYLYQSLHTVQQGADLLVVTINNLLDDPL